MRFHERAQLFLAPVAKKAAEYGYPFGRTALMIRLKIKQQIVRVKKQQASVPRCRASSNLSESHPVIAG
jgi:hypothetical protein